ncbi:MAG: aminomethyl-transferring glycine dehydrogenase [Flavobacteriales bacterium]|nr:aminomethyl-transferring glycine dehydrogenase [Flavobacteriales bacterium]
MKVNEFLSRHVGPDSSEEATMLKAVNAASLDELIAETVPTNIRATNPLNLEPGISEYEYLNHIRSLAKENQSFNSFIGLGYYNCITPPVIQRNVLENPGWYTAYTPYQAEISQGRLEALINFQTMVTDLTAMEIANASLLDEATAASEAMIMFYHARSRDEIKQGKNQFFVSNRCFPQTIEVLKTRSKPFGIELLIEDHNTFEFTSMCFGGLLQYPNMHGAVLDYSDFVSTATEKGVKIVVAADLLSLTLLTPPGEWGADAVVGSTQRFGVPLGYGGPHAAYFATKTAYRRTIPGRIIGVSQDAKGNTAYRMALQTREQHIKRGKATSNICTSQVLLAIMAGMYAVYHGSQGLKNIAQKIHSIADRLNEALKVGGVKLINEHFFDTIHIKVEGESEADKIKEAALAQGVNLLYLEDGNICISVDETTSQDDLCSLASIFGVTISNDERSNAIHPILSRKSEYLTHPVYNTHHSETEMMRYLKSLENKDLSLTHSMIPLGSCTMKLNAAAELFPLTWPEFAAVHPYVPSEQVSGYLKMMNSLEGFLCEVTGFDAVSLQPNSGAQGEYAGLMVIKAYQDSIGQHERNVVLIPSSAHGTNPASAVMAGLSIVVVQCDKHGNIDFHDLEQKASEHSADLCAFMVTYPSTHGVFEASITKVNKIIHEHGGQVYMDGANLNAQIGLTNPATIGADVCHLNLHKTFAIPHGGGGPGMGPIAVASHLAPFLPGHANVAVGGEKGIHSISQAPWGSALILWISYGYIKMLGAEGLTHATKMAILNANYIKARLENHFPILYKGMDGRVAHEMIVDCREFKKTANVEVEDIAKRLIDYGFHAPTVSFPVGGTLMIEPTESEALEELDRFCDAMISIRREISELEDGTADKADNVLINAPHSVHEVTADTWEHSYSRQKAAYPLPWTKSFKYWVPVSRVDNAYGDRNLMCACPPIESFIQADASIPEG